MYRSGTPLNLLEYRLPVSNVQVKCNVKWVFSIPPVSHVQYSMYGGDTPLSHILYGAYTMYT